ncbi:MAG: hypothetical protein J6T57_03225 [Alphaproteobacteria bacterium]|nr:hypothetical protein [Alphaproteobacteria bacterium]
MRKTILFAAIVGLTSIGAYATGENVVTSKTYVDSGISQKQNIITKKATANQVMTFPTTTGGMPGARTIQTSVSSGTDLVTRGGVNTALNAKQNKISGGTSGDVVVYNSSGGISGDSKGVYNASSAYSGQTQKLVEAQHVNGAVANGFNAHLTCSSPANGNTTNCDLWQINTLNAATNAYVPEQ